MIRKVLASPLFKSTKLVQNSFASQKAPVKYTQLFINNEFVDAEDGKTFELINPATEEPIANFARAGEADAEKAVQYARQAFDEGPWRTMSARDRSLLMYKLADLIEKNIDELASLESENTGKTLGFSTHGDMAITQKVIRYYAGLADKIQGTTIPIDGPFSAYTRREPVGVAAQIIPWNFPAAMLSWKWGPCLASGSVSILKTSEKSPMSALRIASLAKEAGFPPGVVQVLNGYGDVGQYLTKHPQVDKVAFTGSENTGRWISQNAFSTNLKRITLELGGKSPNIICHDADLDTAVSQAFMGLYLNLGQCCIAGSRLYVHESIHDAFVEKMVAAVNKVNIGDPFSENTQHGPLIDKIQFERVLGYIQKGKEEGANLVAGGNRYGDKGYYVQPTVFTGVTDDMVISREEIFGPVMQIAKFSDYDEVVKRANDSTFGLGAGIVTNDINTYIKLANGIRAGTVYVNCYNVLEINTPFGGFKNSGIGRELGTAGIEAYLEDKTVIVKRPDGSLP